MAETEERSLDDFFAKRDKKKRKERSSRAAAAASSSSAAASHNAAGAAAAAQGPRPADGGGGSSNAASSGAAGGSAKSKVPGEGSRLPPAAAPGRRRLPAGRGQPRERRRPGHAGGWGGSPAGPGPGPAEPPGGTRRGGSLPTPLILFYSFYLGRVAVRPQDNRALVGSAWQLACGFKRVGRSFGARGAWRPQRAEVRGKRSAAARWAK